MVAVGLEVVMSLYRTIQYVEDLHTHRRFTVATSRYVREARSEQTEFWRLEFPFQSPSHSLRVILLYRPSATAGASIFSTVICISKLLSTTMLHKLPPEVFGVITAKLDFMAVGRLALTCAPMKRVITSSGSVIDATANFEAGLHWMPRILYELPTLSSIQIHTSHLHNRPRLFPDIKHPCQFGKGLKSLIITGTASLALIHSLTLMPGRSSLVDSTNSYHIGEVLPHLEVLKVETNSRAAGHSDLICSVVRTLPPSLTHLALNFGACPSLSHLPNLVQLSLSNCASISDPNFSLAELQYLTHLNAPRLVLNDWNLPFGLEEFSIAQVPIRDDWALKLKRVQKLVLKSLDQPRGLLALNCLVSLTLSSILNLEELLICLPPTMTALDYGSWSSPNRDLSVLCLLPPGLLHLSCAFVTFPAVESFMSDWEARRTSSGKSLENWLPTGLLSWEFHLYQNGEVLHRSWWMLLPQSLTSLNRWITISITPLDHEDETMDISASLPNITSLRVGKEQEGERPVANIILPPRLTSLTLGAIASPTWYQDHREYLPETLVELDVTCDELPPTITPLPSNLTFFSFKVIKPCSGRLLEEPVLGHAPIYMVTDEFAESMKHLPPNLQSIDMKIPLFVPCTTELIKSLPRSLSALTVKCLHQLKDEHVPLLPRNLRYISISHSEITDSSVRFLPSQLYSFVMRNNRSLTPKCLSALPRALRFLYIFKNRNFPRSLHTQLKTGICEIRTRRLKLIPPVSNR